MGFSLKYLNNVMTDISHNSQTSGSADRRFAGKHFNTKQVRSSYNITVYRSVSMLFFMFDFGSNIIHHNIPFQTTSEKIFFFGGGRGGAGGTSRN